MLDGATDEAVLNELEAAAPKEAAAPVPEPKGFGGNAVAAGAGLAITPDVLADPEKRKKLAESLEQLAAWLRQGS